MGTELNNYKTVKLCRLAVGDKGGVVSLGVKGAFRRRLLDLGIVEGTVIECVGRSPMGDPIAFLIRGAVIALRAEDCEAITVLPLEDIEGGK